MSVRRTRVPFDTRTRDGLRVDNARRNHLRTLGWHLLVYTWVDVTRHAEHTAQEILANYRRLVA